MRRQRRCSSIDDSGRPCRSANTNVSAWSPRTMMRRRPVRDPVYRGLAW